MQIQITKATALPAKDGEQFITIEGIVHPETAQSHEFVERIFSHPHSDAYAVVSKDPKDGLLKFQVLVSAPEPEPPAVEAQVGSDADGGDGAGASVDPLTPAA